MLRQDNGRDRVAVFKLWIVVEIRQEKLALLFLDIRGLDDTKNTELFGIFCFSCDCCFVHRRKFSKTHVGDIYFPNLWNGTGV